MYTPKEDYDAVRSIWRTRKQREATITVLICTAGFVLTLAVVVLLNWREGWK